MPTSPHAHQETGDQVQNQLLLHLPQFPPEAAPAEQEETLVVDPRGALTAAQMIDRKLLALLTTHHRGHGAGMARVGGGPPAPEQLTQTVQAVSGRDGRKYTVSFYFTQPTRAVSRGKAGWMPGRTRLALADGRALRHCGKGAYEAEDGETFCCEDPGAP